MTDIIIIGGGPAGLSAAIYARRALLRVLVAEKDYMGTGQIAASDKVDNYPGLPGISGYDLGEKLHSHAEALGAKFICDEAVKLTRTDRLWEVSFKSGKVLSAGALIFAAGTSRRTLGVKGDKLRGVSYCAVCDGAFYENKPVAVAGGGDTALSDALYLSETSSKVYLIHRRNEFRGSRYLQEQVKAKKNIEKLMDTVITEVKGNESVTAVSIASSDGERDIQVSGIFCAYGSVPNSSILKGICELDPNGFVKAGEDGITTAEGIYAAGDVRTTPLRQAVTAAADGANAAISAEKLLRAEARSLEIRG